MCIVGIHFSSILFNTIIQAELTPPGAGIIVLLHVHQALRAAATAVSKKVLSDSLNTELIYVFRCELDIV